MYPGHGIAQRVSGPAVLWEPIADRQASNDARIDIAWTGDYDAVFIDLFNMRPVTDAVRLYCRASGDGGATFDAGASDYDFRTVGFFASQANVGGAAAQIDMLLTVVGNDADAFGSGSFVMPRPFDTAEQTPLIGFGGLTGTASNPGTFLLYGRRASAGRVDALRFFYSSGNIAEGRITATGLRRA